MKFCIITDVPVGIKHGLGQYIRSLVRIFSLGKDTVYNIFEISSVDVEYINKNFDFVSIQIGILKKNQIYVADTLSQISIPKIATIHSVVDEEIFWLEHCLDNYFPNSDKEFNTLYREGYLTVLSKLDGLVFYTENDMKIFEKYYDVKTKKSVIPPSIQYITDSVESKSIKKTNLISFLGRIDYRKGIIASLNSMEFLPDYNLKVYGEAVDQHNIIILNYFLSKNKNIMYEGLVNDRYSYYSNTSIFLGNSLYEPFGFSHVENLFNFVVPIIGRGTGTHDMFGNNYPYAIDDSVPELVDTVKRIEKTGEKELSTTLVKVQKRLLHLTDENFKNEYFKFIKSVIQ
jgi:glycogen synthase